MPADGAQDECPYVSRGGLKMEHALREFGLDPSGMVCADLGASTGGFTDCLLRHGAASVYAVDTAYGEFAWRLRNDPRVVVMERSNALHAAPPKQVSDAGGVDLVVIDLGWTRQRHAIPAALRWMKPGGLIITLIKPHYEVGESGARVGETVLAEEEARAITDRVVSEMPMLGVRAVAVTRSPVLGGSVGAKRKKKGTGNAEWLVLLERTESG
ncbi:MAG: class I SAM-dependent methyltransferase [Phycisphaeraceae bacterium]|nr:class I SAM-dependent methyltransferase [Phycisphaeraceae bacterium]